jgi:hypothetical protein
MAGEKFYDTPVSMYLRDKSNGEIMQYDIIGETSRSWLFGYRWSHDRISKSGHDIVAAIDHQRQMWVRKHTSFIIRKIEYGRLPFEVMAKIADAIGYAEPQPVEPPKDSEAA